MKKKIIFIFVCLILFSLVFLSFNKLNAQTPKGIDNPQDFKNALSKQQKQILVSNIEFDNEIIILNYDVEIKGVSNNTTLKNIYFVITGPNYLDSFINVKFSNLILDGGFEKDLESLKQNKSYVDIIGSERENNRCIDGNSGYYNLTIDNVEIMNYSSEIGACLFIENNYRDSSKSVTITNSKFHNNISSKDNIHLSNDKLNIKISNCEFYNNYAFKGAGFSIANGSSYIEKVNVHDNYFLQFDYEINTIQNSGGGVFVGGTNLVFKDSIIKNNESGYGGGLSVTSTKYGESGVVFSNVVFENNKAKYGGAVTCSSLIGQPIYFINCLFKDNEAEYGSSLYTEVYAYFNKTNSGGLIEVLFSTFIDNKALDNKTFTFYKEEETKGSIGTISLKGSIVIGDDLYQATEGDYNYIATKDTAILQGALKDDVCPVKGSVADIDVPSKVYKKWSSDFSKYYGNIKSGYSLNNPKLAKNLYTILIVIIVVFAVLATALTILLLHRHKKTNSKDEIDEGSPSLLDTLSERELEVVRLMINLKKRKEIAKELNYSESTIKKDLSAIYTKLDISDKSELIVKYKDLIKKKEK